MIAADDENVANEIINKLNAIEAAIQFKWYESTIGSDEINENMWFQLKILKEKWI